MSIRSAWPRVLCQRGVSLIELVIAIVIISVGLAGVLTAFSVTVRNSSDPLIRKKMLAIAEGMMEEVFLQPYAPAANSAAVGCARNTFNDIGDNNGYATAGMICDADGNQIAALAGYSLSVAVTADAATFSGNGVSAASKITVTVTYGAQSISLVSWRTNYAT